MHLLRSIEFIKRLITGIVLGIGFWAIYFYCPPIFFSLVLIAILLMIIVYEWTRFFSVNTLTFWLSMPLYLILPFVLLILLNHDPLYRDLLLILFVIVFSFDTGSYIGGNLFGKHYISQTISPRKTWEGAIAGYLFASIGLGLLIMERGYQIKLSMIAPFTLIICSLALLGDLFESWLKRQARLKDSGTFLPGHGGFLDRFDGILFAVFLFYLAKSYLIQLFFK